MKDILFLAVTGLILYVISRIALKEPILPWGEKKNRNKYQKNVNEEKKTKKKNNSLEEEEAKPFKELFSEIEEIDNHMIRRKDNTFSLIVEVEPVNYFLLDSEEQEGIDAIFETWLAQINYSVRIYLQNRYVDLTLPIEEIQKIMQEEDDLHPLAKEYGQNMIDDMKDWQQAQPRFETKRFMIFDYQVDTKDIKAESEEEYDSKIIEKAFSELRRRFNTAENQLRKADMRVHMLTTNGITELLYYGFNRRRALKNNYRDVADKEQLALYVTSDQDVSRMIRVKEELENVQEKREEIESL